VQVLGGLFTAFDWLARRHGLEKIKTIGDAYMVAGVIGTTKFSYDLWGDTVNVASRMESQGVAGRIQVTDRAYRRLRDGYRFEPRDPIQVKGKGELTTWFPIGRNGRSAPTA
jgi:class 3 adenylate cyclase